MTTTTPGQTARTHPLDDAVSSYGIELNHAGNPSTDRPIRQLRSTSVRTNVPAMDADRTLISLMLAHSSETQLHSSYRGNSASSLPTAGTPWQHADRGPPGARLSGDSPRSHRAHGRTQARGTSWIRREEEQRKRDRGLGRQIFHPKSPLQEPR